MDAKGIQTPTSLATIPIEEERVFYIAIKGSLHANDCSVFGLGQEEINAITKKFPGSSLVYDCVNGVTLKTNVLNAINSLNQLGYKVISSTDMDKDSCGHCNCIHSAPKSVCQNLSEMDWERGIWSAAYSGDKEKVQGIIDKSRDPSATANAPDNSGYTAMHYAARTGQVDILKLLLNYGANINAETSGKATPLHKAAAAGKMPALFFLMKHGACLSARDVDGETPLHKAVYHNNKELAQVLLEACPELAHMKDNKGRLAMESSDPQ